MSSAKDTSRRQTIDLMNLAGVSGFLISLVIGMLLSLDGLLTIVSASVYLGVCFIWASLLSVYWRVSMSAF